MKLQAITVPNVLVTGKILQLVIVHKNTMKTPKQKNVSLVTILVLNVPVNLEKIVLKELQKKNVQKVENWLQEDVIHYQVITTIQKNQKPQNVITLVKSVLNLEMLHQQVNLVLNVIIHNIENLKYLVIHKVNVYVLLHLDLVMIIM